MKRQRNSQERRNFTPSSFETILVPYQFEFIKSLLYRTFSGELSFDQLTIVRMVARSDGIYHKTKLLAIAIEEASDFVRVIDNFITATVIFNGKNYDLCMYLVERHDWVYFYIFALGLEPEAQQSTDLVNLVNREALQHSPYRNKMIQIKPEMNGVRSEGMMMVEQFKLEDDQLCQIFLPESIRDSVDLFVRTLQQYHSVRKPLRFLFAGKPGTAKTKIIRAIANACAGKATFVFTNGNEERIEAMFDFASLFSPVVVCIDDLDLMTGSRNEGLYTQRLALFLQKLDGFAKKDFFLLATTNDKRLVDLAASRPGRFDLVIDVNLIKPQQYVELVKSKTNHSDIIELFDDDILTLLETKKVTGAFIANIIKHLELIAEFDGSKLNKEYLMNLIKESHQGFYETPEPTNGKPGFHMQ